MVICKLVVHFVVFACTYVHLQMYFKRKLFSHTSQNTWNVALISHITFNYTCTCMNVKHVRQKYLNALQLHESSDFIFRNPKSSALFVLMATYMYTTLNSHVLVYFTRKLQIVSDYCSWRKILHFCKSLIDHNKYNILKIKSA